MIKIPALRPTLREKTRYIAFQAESQDSITKKDVEQAIKHELFSFLGATTAAKAGLKIMNTEMNKGTCTGIIKIERDFVDNVRASLTLTRSINNKPAFIRSLRTSGMIAKAKEGLPYAN